MSRDRFRLAAAIGLQLVLLALVPAPQVLAGARGQLVTLATAPVDPFDPFSGAYVRLAYEVEQPAKGIPYPELAEGDALYLVVGQASPTWRIVEYATALPAPEPGRAALKATWHHGRPRLESAGKLYLPAETAVAAEAALTGLRQEWWKARADARAEAREHGTPFVEPTPPSAEVDLRVDETGAIRLIELRVGGQTFKD
jgi:hypothetical protein